MVPWRKACVIFVVCFVSFFNHVLCEDKNCTCHPESKNFDEPISDEVSKGCRKCYQFTYDFSLDQDWAARICIDSPTSSKHTPLLVTVREKINIFSFQVPQVFDDRSKSPFSYVCHTLCPLANYFDEEVLPGKQDIFVELTTQEKRIVGYDVILSVMKNFTISMDHPITVNITPSEPLTLQYNLDKKERASRIEVSSPDQSCMILAVQNIQCPFSDSAKMADKSGFYQTLMTKSAIALTKNFPMDKVYIVLLLRPTNDFCLDYDKHAFIPIHNAFKEVTVTVVPAITDGEYYAAIFGALGVFLLIYIFSFITCLCFRTNNSAEDISVDTESQAQNYGTSSDRENSLGVSSDVHVENFDETDMDTMPDAEVDKTVIRTRHVLYVSDLARKKPKALNKRSKLYSWNLFTIAIFYALPVVQLVYINQRIVNLTGNQDICYYNFLCSHQVMVFSDFNHIYSNIGYCLLGLLFMCLVWRRESQHVSAVNSRGISKQMNATGIPKHFGLLYSLGLALIIEGVLSGCYHVCPNKANFQFDTAFMYVIALVFMLKLYEARHPDITAQSHTTWVALSVVIFCGVGGILDGGLPYWIIFVLIHLTICILVIFKIYYMSCVKYDLKIFKRMHHNVQQMRASKSFWPQYKGRFILLLLTLLVNAGLDVYALVKQPNDFATYILIVFIVNLFMYLIYYIIMKLRHGEKIGWIPYLYMVLSIVAWVFAGIFFLEHNTSWKLTPAESRENNKHCIILNFYDHHDVWHFISSCALFFSYMVLFTLDDNLENKPRNTIKVF